MIILNRIGAINYGSDLDLKATNTTKYISNITTSVYLLY